MLRPADVQGAAIGLERRDAQHLTGLDFVRVAQHRLIGLENLLVMHTIAQRLFGDRPKRVTLLDGVERRLALAALDIVLNRGHAFDVTHGKNDLLAHFLRGGFACHSDLVAVDFDVQTLGIQAQILQLVLQCCTRHFGIITAT